MLLISKTSKHCRGEELNCVTFRSLFIEMCLPQITIPTPTCIAFACKLIAQLGACKVFLYSVIDNG